VDGIDYLIEDITRKLLLAKIGRGTKKSINLLDDAIEDLKQLKAKLNEKIKRQT